MKQKRILNICMVVVILLTIGCGIMAVGTVKGWFAKADDTSWRIAEKTGIAMVERSGAAYEVTTGTMMKSQDRYYTKAAASLVLAHEEDRVIYMGSNADLTADALEETPEFTITKGEVLGDTRDNGAFIFLSGKGKMVLQNALASVSAQSGAVTVHVYSGEVLLENRENPEKEPITVEAGKKVLILEQESDYEIGTLKVQNLSEMQIAALKARGLDKNCCFTESDLTKTQKQRKTEKKEQTQNAASSTQEEPESSTNGDNEQQSDAKNPEENNTKEEVAVPEQKPSCTIQIVCDTILNNGENLNPEKAGYLPSSGVVLGTTPVEFTDGETVFDVLQRVCTENNIQIEYAYTPIYESYYIEGINHIYEFDCGPESGWMYKVNGWFPNYGCSSYTLEDGDAIVWCYTCVGLGADVGGSNF